ncbi:hypothetical protein JCM30237_05180 [Halolamina litorea]|uniref:AMP-binding enzyme n=1 Tax=Halolamina litorea TaxID=1515593 RepID=A0ABD6BPL1_9EURY|nr:hypothetical protein [Halolamina litorea]
MNVVGDLLARERRSDRPALVIGDRERSYHELLTNAYKAGNVLRFYGVGEGRPLAAAPVPDLPPVLAFLGAAQLGAATRFDPAAGADAGDRLVLVPTAEEAAYDPAPGTKLAVFGGEADDADTIDWEESVWSENPAFPPTRVDPETPLLLDGDRSVSHAAALEAATEVAEMEGLGEESRVVVRSSLAEPGAVVAGLLAPLLVGGCAVLADPSAAAEDGLGDLAISGNEAPEPARIAPGSVPLSD